MCKENCVDCSCSKDECQEVSTLSMHTPEKITAAIPTEKLNKKLVITLTFTSIPDSFNMRKLQGVLDEVKYLIENTRRRYSIENSSCETKISLIK